MELRKYIKVPHKPIITITKFDLGHDTYFIKNGHLFERDCIGDEEVDEDLGEIIAMSNDKKDLIKLQKYTRIEKSKLEQLKKEHKALQILKKHLHFEIDSYDCDDQSASFECLCVDDLGYMDVTQEERDFLMGVI